MQWQPTILDYRVDRGPELGPFIHFKDGRTLTRARFVDVVQKALVTVGIDVQCSGHSFRIRAATAAVAKVVAKGI